MPKQQLNKYDKKHLANLKAYERQIDRIFQSAVREAAKISGIVSDFNHDKQFSFKDYPATSKRVEKLLTGLKNDIESVVLKGIDHEWTLSNNKNNELSNRVFGDNVGKLTEQQYRRYYRNNEEARDAFKTRQEAGLSLSDRVWEYTTLFKSEIEQGIDLGMRDGISADELSRDLRSYLKYPDKLFRRVRDIHGSLVLSQAAKAFHPGRGVYRSSYKNARRLAATEINMAYRTADYLRWQQLDFVVGIKICLSNNHTLNGQPFHDICDELAGDYPKDFKFTGWHPQCRCHAVSILKTEEELMEENKRILAGKEPEEGSVNSIYNLPNPFTDWAKQNEERAKKGKFMPYFLRDNKGMLDGFYLDEAIKEVCEKAFLSGNEVQGLAESIADVFGAKCTKINFKSADSIKRKVYLERNKKPVFLPNKLKDTVRTTIVANKNNDIQGIIEMLKNSDVYLKHKSQNTPLGYTGHIVNIKTKSGLIGEIQVNTAKMIYAKEEPAIARQIIGDDLWNKIHKETGLEGGLGHKFYEEHRILNPASAEAQKILEQSKEYYSHFNH